MSDDDPWSRPTLKDLQEILEHIQKPDTENRRNVDRLELSVPAEIVTSRGNTVAAMMPKSAVRASASSIVARSRWAR